MQGEILRGSETDLRILSDVQWFWVLVIHTFGEATRRDILHTPNNTGREDTNERPLCCAFILLKKTKNIIYVFIYLNLQ